MQQDPHSLQVTHAHRVLFVSASGDRCSAVFCSPRRVGRRPAAAAAEQHHQVVSQSRRTIASIGRSSMQSHPRVVVSPVASSSPVARLHPRPPSRSRAQISSPAPVDTSSLSLDGESYASSLVLDLRDQAYNDLHMLTSKFPSRGSRAVAFPWRILILSGNMLSRLDGLQRCASLRKLDLSRNGLDALPKSTFWKQLRQLQVLHLHQNKIDSIHALQTLVSERIRTQASWQHSHR